MRSGEKEGCNDQAYAIDDDRTKSSTSYSEHGRAKSKSKGRAQCGEFAEIIFQESSPLGNAPIILLLNINIPYNVGWQVPMEKHFIIWKKAFKESISLNSVLAAAGMAYFALFSFFPIILLIVAIASLRFDPLWVESELIIRLEFVIPGISQLLGNNLAKLVAARGSVTTTAMLLLAWSGSTLYSMIARILDSIWSGADVRPGLRYRGFALLFVGATAFIVLPLLIIGTWAAPLARNLLPFQSFFLSPIMTLLYSLLVSVLLFALLYRFLPHAGPRWRDVWIGALSAGLVWEIAKKGFVAYIANFLSGSNLVYGSVSTIIAFLMWVHLSGLIFFFGAYLGKGYSLDGQEERRKEKRRWRD